MPGLRLWLYLAGQRAAGSRAGAGYREFLSLEGQAPEAVRRLQAGRLERLLDYAASRVPFYRARLGGRARPGLPEFPILTKDLVREQFRNLMSPELARQWERGNGFGYSWKTVQTGGTTGTPTTVVHDKHFRDYGRASRLYSQRLCGFPFGTPYLRLWGSMRDINGMRDSAAQRLTRRLGRETMLNAFRMDESRMRDYVEIINRSRARHLMAYVDCAAQLARYIRARGGGVRPLDSVMACAGTVTPELRSLIEEVFRCRVHNKYGSRECSDMACECDRGGLHIYANHVLLEVVDERGRALPAGRQGRILVTLLNNYAFPMIRYEIGDIGSLADGMCPCGRGFPLLEGIEGRTSEMLLAPGGRAVTPTYIRHLVGVIHNPGIVWRFQFVQNAPADFTLTLETDQSAPESLFRAVVANLERDLKAALGENSRIETRRVSSIPEADNGKFLYVVSKVAR